MNADHFKVSYSPLISRISSLLALSSAPGSPTAVEVKTESAFPAEISIINESTKSPLSTETFVKEENDLLSSSSSQMAAVGTSKSLESFNTDITIPEKDKVQVIVSTHVQENIVPPLKVDVDIQEEGAKISEIGVMIVSKTEEADQVKTEISEEPDIKPGISEEPDIKPEISEEPDIKPEISEEPDIKPEISEEPDIKPELMTEQKVKVAAKRKRNHRPELVVETFVLRTFRCKICFYSVNSLAELLKHGKIVHNLKFNGAPTVLKYDEKDQSNKEIESMKKLSNLLQSKENESSVQKKRRIDSSDSQSKAVVKSKRKTSYVRCHLCFVDFKYQEELNYHLKKHEDNIILSCSHCGMGFSMDFTLKQHNHLEIDGGHQSSSLHKCSFQNCESSFINRKCLLFHLTRHDGFHRCQICEMSFKLSDQVQNHVQQEHYMNVKEKSSSHITDELVRCTHKGCGKLVPNLRKHICDVHYKFKCPFCGKASSTQFNCQQHIKRMHLDGKINAPEKLYKCTLCPKSFSYLNILGRHMTVTHNRGKKKESLKKSIQEAAESKKPLKKAAARRISKSSSIYDKYDPDKDQDEGKILLLPDEKGRYNCNLCDAHYSALWSVIRHQVNAHGKVTVQYRKRKLLQYKSSEESDPENKETNQNQCKKCRFRFTSSQELNRHRRFHHPQSDDSDMHSSEAEENDEDNVETETDEKVKITPLENISKVEESVDFSEDDEMVPIYSEDEDNNPSKIDSGINKAPYFCKSCPDRPKYSSLWNLNRHEKPRHRFITFLDKGKRIFVPNKYVESKERIITSNQKQVKKENDSEDEEDNEEDENTSETSSESSESSIEDNELNNGKPSFICKKCPTQPSYSNSCNLARHERNAHSNSKIVTNTRPKHQFYRGRRKRRGRGRGFGIVRGIQNGPTTLNHPNTSNRRKTGWRGRGRGRGRGGRGTTRLVSVSEESSNTKTEEESDDIDDQHNLNKGGNKYEEESKDDSSNETINLNNENNQPSLNRKLSIENTEDLSTTTLITMRLRSREGGQRVNYATLSDSRIEHSGLQDRAKESSSRKNSSKPFVCPLCEKEFSRLCFLTRHIRSSHKDSEEIIYSILQKKNATSYKCRFCEKWYGLKQTAMSHVLSHHKDEHTQKFGDYRDFDGFFSDKEESSNSSNEQIKDDIDVENSKKKDINFLDKDLITDSFHSAKDINDEQTTENQVCLESSDLKENTMDNLRVNHLNATTNDPESLPNYCDAEVAREFIQKQQKNVDEESKTIEKDQNQSISKLNQNDDLNQMRKKAPSKYSNRMSIEQELEGLYFSINPIQNSTPSIKSTQSPSMPPVAPVPLDVLNAAQILQNLGTTLAIQLSPSGKIGEHDRSLGYVPAPIKIDTEGSNYPEEIPMEFESTQPKAEKIEETVAEAFSNLEHQCTHCPMKFATKKERHNHICNAHGFRGFQSCHKDPLA